MTIPQFESWMEGTVSCCPLQHARCTTYKSNQSPGIPWLSFALAPLLFGIQLSTHVSTASDATFKTSWYDMSNGVRQCKVILQDTRNTHALSLDPSLRPYKTGRFPRDHLRYDHCRPLQKFSLPWLAPFFNCNFRTPPTLGDRSDLAGLLRTVMLLNLLPDDLCNMSRAWWQSDTNGSPSVAAQVLMVARDCPHSR